MYFVVIVILSLVLAFGSPPFARLRDPAWVALAVAAAVLVPPAVALLVNRRALSLLDRRADEPAYAQRALGRGMPVVQGALLAAHAGLLLGTDWLGLCERLPGAGDWIGVAGLLACVPFVVSLTLVWVALYPSDRGIRQIALEVAILRGKPAHPVWSLGGYLAYNLRHQLLLVLVPMAAILVVRDAVAHNDRALRAQHPFLPDLLLGLAAAAVAVLAPLMLRLVWQTAPLPDGPLRLRLTDLSRRLKMRCREILVWRSGGMIVNAAVMGVVAPLRYVLISDAMIEQLEDAKIEAVFGHEAGHVKRHHVQFLLLLALISACIVAVLSVRTQHVDARTYEVVTLAAGVLLLFKWGVVFGWISRRFEQQADAFGVSSLTLMGLPCHLPCALHSSAQPASAPRRATLCASAAALYGDTLNEVAVLNGISPEARSWRHPSIASRSRFVQRLAGDPARAARFERSIAWIKATIAVCAALAALWAAWELRLWTLLDGLLRFRG